MLFPNSVGSPPAPGTVGLTPAQTGTETPPSGKLAPLLAEDRYFQWPGGFVKDKNPSPSFFLTLVLVLCLPGLLSKQNLEFSVL